VSAEVLAAAGRTLSDVDAVLAEAEAAAAVAWLDDAFNRLQAHLDHWRVSTPWFAPPSEDRVVRTYMEAISTGEGAGRAMLGVYAPPGARELADGTLAWDREVMDVASWPTPQPADDIRSWELDEDEHECRCHMHPPCSHCVTCRRCAEAAS